MMGDRNEFLAILNVIREKRIKDDERFLDYEQDRIISSRERYNDIFDEIARISESIFKDDEFYEEQFGHYSCYDDYIEDMADEFAKDDSDRFSPLAQDSLAIR